MSRLFYEGDPRARRHTFEGHRDRSGKLMKKAIKERRDRTGDISAVRRGTGANLKGINRLRRKDLTNRQGKR